MRRCFAPARFGCVWNILESFSCAQALRSGSFWGVSGTSWEAFCVHRRGTPALFRVLGRLLLCTGMGPHLTLGFFWHILEGFFCALVLHSCSLLLFLAHFGSKLCAQALHSGSLWSVQASWKALLCMGCFWNILEALFLHRRCNSRHCYVFLEHLGGDFRAHARHSGSLWGAPNKESRSRSEESRSRSKKNAPAVRALAPNIFQRNLD